MARGSLSNNWDGADVPRSYFRPDGEFLFRFSGCKPSDELLRVKIDTERVLVIFRTEHIRGSLLSRIKDIDLSLNLIAVGVSIIYAQGHTVIDTPDRFDTDSLALSI